MITIEEMEVMLDEISQEIPAEFYNELNGGILLLPEVKHHPRGRANDLYILGEYIRAGNMGRYIAIYYGSVQRAYGYMRTEELRPALKKLLLHEFTHHIESLAGEKSLEKKDEEELRDYMEGNR